MKILRNTVNVSVHEMRSVCVCVLIGTVHCDNQVLNGDSSTNSRLGTELNKSIGLYNYLIRFQMQNYIKWISHDKYDVL
jgi:hypothetical protein